MKTALSWIVVALLAGCAIVAPKTFTEQVAYAEASAQASLKTVGDLTCTKGYDKNAVCLEPGKPLTPEKSLELINRLGDVRMALKASTQLPAKGGSCLGATRTPEDCLLAAQQILLQVETFLRTQQGG